MRKWQFLHSIAFAILLLASSVPQRALAGCEDPFLSPIPRNTSLLVASNRTPHTARVENNQVVLGPSGGGLVTALKSTGAEFTWIGWPGHEIRDEQQGLVQTALRHSDTPLDIRPIFFSDEEKRGFYDNFSNRVVWPVFHGLGPMAESPQAGWETYVEINQRFANELMKSIEETANRSSDPILAWVHDYQLLLVPQMLREQLRAKDLLDRVRIGFFLHIPFPNLQDWSAIPPDVRESILKSMLAADHLAFQTPVYEHAFRV